MIPLRKVAVAGYRCFAARQELTLRRLTLIFGWNNAGKTSLLRLLPIIDASLAEEASSPLELTSTLGDRSTFLDVIWKGPRPAGGTGMTLELHFADSDPISHVQYQIRVEKLDMSPRIDAVELFAASKRLAHAKYVPQDDGSSSETAPIYETSLAGRQRSVRRSLQFRGLMPGVEAGKPFAQLRAQLDPLRGSVQWLRAGRSQRDRYLPLGASPRRLAPDGWDAGLFLRSEPAIMKAVNDFYRIRFQRALAIKEDARAFRLVLTPTDQANMDIDLIDSGEGLQRALPVLVGAELVRRKTGPRILVVEEPEANLHDNAQRFLGEHLCSLVKRDAPDPPQLLLETHSQPLLLSVQLAVASGDVSPDDVAIYWVHTGSDGQAFARLVPLDEQGRLQGLPPGTFADSEKLARELLATQLGGRP